MNVGVVASRLEFPRQENPESGARQQSANDDSAKAPLSAHQCNSLLPGMRDQLVQSNLKLRRLHVVCIPSEALVPPACVDRVPPGMSQTPEPGHMAITDAPTS